MKSSLLILSTLVILLSNCSKDPLTANVTNPGSDKNPKPTDNLPVASKLILVDASRDGGVWWFPQSNASGFSEINNHQGQQLANYFRSLGYKVDELTRGTIITKEILSKYVNVIRAGGFGNYSEEEMTAYKTFLDKPSSLLLLQDHLLNFSNDQLSAYLGIQFEGAHQGTVYSFTSHPVTTGVTTFPFMMGSIVHSPYASNITILGSIQINAGGENITAGVMGILDHPTSKIFFIGEMNGLETVPQPFTSNLISWLFR